MILYKSVWFWFLLLAFVFIVVLIISYYKRNKISESVFLALLSALFGASGYFISNYLEYDRQLRKDKLEQYIQLTKGLKMFLNDNALSTQDLKKQRDELNDAYFSSSLLISSESMALFGKFMDEYQKLYKAADRKNEKLIQAQEDFINSLRSEFIKEDPIIFRPTQFTIADSLSIKK